MKKQTVNRLIDANLNRSKEGLRVLEDISRFILDDPGSTRKWRAFRHRLTAAVSDLGWTALLFARNIEGDVGRSSIASELKRRDVKDIFYANAQRVKESVRVLEEFSKLENKKTAKDLKQIRYGVYALERTAAAKL